MCVCDEAMWKVLMKLGVPEMMVSIIKSFHQDMKARLCIDGKVMDPITVAKGLRQGCYMAPVLFNLYTCAVMEKWLEKRETEVEVGVRVLYKLDGKLFRRLQKCRARVVTDCLFADDGALLSSSRSGAESAIRAYQCVSFGLTVNSSKTKHMVTGRLAAESDRAAIQVEGGTIECVKEFSYLGSQVDDSGRIDGEVERQIGLASRAFGALRKAVFLDRNLTLTTKRMIYRACVVSVLILYGSECWTPLKRHVNMLNSFHYRCIRTILGISNRQQWEERISKVEVRKRWGDQETVRDMVIRKRLEWHRLPSFFTTLMPHLVTLSTKTPSTYFTHHFPQLRRFPLLLLGIHHLLYLKSA